jgi:hypothetical protein
MIEYKIASSFQYSTLEDEVNRLIRTGYKPHGSLVVHVGGGIYLQPMVKETTRYENKGPG